MTRSRLIWTLIVLTAVVVMLPFACNERHRAQQMQIAQQKKDDEAESKLAELHAKRPHVYKPYRPSAAAIKKWNDEFLQTAIRRGASGHGHLESEQWEPAARDVGTWTIGTADIFISSDNPQGWRVRPDGKITVPADEKIKAEQYVAYVVVAKRERDGKAEELTRTYLFHIAPIQPGELDF